MLLRSFRRKRQHQAFGIGTYQTEHKNIFMDTFIKKPSGNLETKIQRSFGNLLF